MTRGSPSRVATGAPARVDALGALSAWVEQGRAPAGLQPAEQNIQHRPHPPAVRMADPATLSRQRLDGQRRQLRLRALTLSPTEAPWP